MSTCLDFDSSRHNQETFVAEQQEDGDTHSKITGIISDKTAALCPWLEFSLDNCERLVRS